MVKIIKNGATAVKDTAVATTKTGIKNAVNGKFKSVVGAGMIGMGCYKLYQGQELTEQDMANMALGWAMITAMG